MEKTIDHLNREIVKLQEELVNLETKASAAADAAPNQSNLSAYFFLLEFGAFCFICL